MVKLDLSSYHDIVVLTGAGISVASGIRPFRGPGGLWEEIDPMTYATHEAILTEPLMVWKLFGVLRTQLITPGPNRAHTALAKFESALDKKHHFTLITQNIDGLHLKAGSRNVVELHGSITRTRCTNDGCELTPFVEDDPHADQIPFCPICQSPLRPDIVLFNEWIPAESALRCYQALENVDLFMAVGTSGEVYPAAGFVRSAVNAGARTILVNLEPLNPPNPYFKEEYLGKAEDLLPELLGE